MSRSRKHSPCICWCGRTNKMSKRFANRRFRRLAHSCVRRGLMPPNRTREICDVWNFDRNGLVEWHNDIDKRFLRK